MLKVQCNCDIVKLDDTVKLILEGLEDNKGIRDKDYLVTLYQDDSREPIIVAVKSGGVTGLPPDTTIYNGKCEIAYRLAPDSSGTIIDHITIIWQTSQVD